MYAGSQERQAVHRSGSVSRGRISAVNVLQLTSAKDMKMQVRNCLPAALTHVCRYPIPLGDSLAVRHFTSKSEGFAKKQIVLRAQVMDGGNVVPGHNKHMNRRPRELVPERSNVITSRNPIGRLLAGHYPTEQARAVVHLLLRSSPRLLAARVGRVNRLGRRSHPSSLSKHAGRSGHSQERWSTNRSASRGRGATTVTSQAKRRPSRIASPTRSAIRLRSPSGTTSQRTTSRCSTRSMTIR